ncbi:MAG: glucose-6-phosphate isomerase [Deltaproteobacteria bacterium]
MKNLNAGGPVSSVKGFEARILSALRGLERHGFSKRLWAKDPCLWKDTDEAADIIKRSLGWLMLPAYMQQHAQEIEAFALEIKESGIDKVILLGMGGSSLAPLVLTSSIRRKKGYPRLIVLDSTDPEAIRQVLGSMDPEKTLFIVSSKSGSTIEPASLFSFFYEAVKAGNKGNPGGHFIAITDSGTVLESIARQRGFRRIFINPSDIGGRFSALSFFGLVPAALSGIDVSRLLFHALRLLVGAHPFLPEHDNPSVTLGAALGALAAAGRDKLTFLLTKETRSFGLWLEQLIAESTGKEAKGIIPVVLEPALKPDEYSDDRVFAYIGLGGPSQSVKTRLNALIKAGHPVFTFYLNDIYELGGEFLRWEIATAAAGGVLGINPFDQPDVEIAKALARDTLKGNGGRQRAVPAGQTIEAAGFLSAYFSGRAPSGESAGGKPALSRALEGFFGIAERGDYIAILSYYNPFDRAIERELKRLVNGLRQKTTAAITFGYGPRYLHSTGQLHKGGRNNGVFLMLAHKTGDDIGVPETSFGFSGLELSQAMGDMQALSSRQRRACLLVIDDPSAGSLKRAVSLALNAIKKTIP